MDPIALIEAQTLQPLIARQGANLVELDDKLRAALKKAPDAYRALRTRLGPLQQNQRQMEQVCSQLHRAHSSPLKADEIAGKFMRPYGIENRFKMEAGTVAENIEAMGRPLESDVQFALFQQKRKEKATALGFGDDKANAWHIGTFDKDARIPSTDLCEIYTFELTLRKLDHTDVSISDERIIGEARIYLVLNSGNPLFLGEGGDFMRVVRQDSTGRLRSERPVRWGRPLAIVRPDDDVSVRFVFPDKAAAIADKIIGRLRSVGPYYTEYGGLVD